MRDNFLAPNSRFQLTLSRIISSSTSFPRGAIDPIFAAEQSAGHRYNCVLSEGIKSSLTYANHERKTWSELSWASAAHQQAGHEKRRTAERKLRTVKKTRAKNAGQRLGSARARSSDDRYKRVSHSQVVITVWNLRSRQQHLPSLPIKQEEDQGPPRDPHCWPQL